MEEGENFKIDAATKREGDEKERKETDDEFFKNLYIVSNRLGKLEKHLEDCRKSSGNNNLECITDLIGGITMGVFMSFGEGEGMTDDCRESFGELKVLYYPKMLALEARRYSLWVNEFKKNRTEEEIINHEREMELFIDDLSKEMLEFKKSVDAVLDASIQGKVK